jgi:beta-glucanase (GH16 family)
MKINDWMNKSTFKTPSALWLFVFITFYACSMQKNVERNAPIMGYKLVWNDEFDGSQVDTAKWAFRTDVKHRSVQLRENVSQKAGILKLNLHQLTAALKGKMATGAGIISKTTFKYGYYEVKSRLGDKIDDDKDGKTDEGWHHAFWAMAASINAKGEVNTTYPPSRRTEIDCYENASTHKHEAENSIHKFTQHIIIWKADGKEFGRVPKTPTDIIAIPNFNAHEWHTYGFEWTEKTVTFYVDGKITHVADYAATQFEHDNLNIWITAMAADWTGTDQENSSAEYDYVRFYSK